MHRLPRSFAKQGIVTRVVKVKLMPRLHLMASTRYQNNPSTPNNPDNPNHNNTSTANIPTNSNTSTQRAIL